MLYISIYHKHWLPGFKVIQSAKKVTNQTILLVLIIAFTHLLIPYIYFTDDYWSMPLC